MWIVKMFNEREKHSDSHKKVMHSNIQHSVYKMNEFTFIPNTANTTVYYVLALVATTESAKQWPSRTREVCRKTLTRRTTTATGQNDVQVPQTDLIDNLHLQQQLRPSYDLHNKIFTIQSVVVKTCEQKNGQHYDERQRATVASVVGTVHFFGYVADDFVLSVVMLIVYFLADAHVDYYQQMGLYLLKILYICIDNVSNTSKCQQHYVSVDLGAAIIL